MRSAKRRFNPPPSVPELSASPAIRQLCPSCGAELAAQLLACPSCGQLVHAEQLKRLAVAAESAATHSAALTAWREALLLLPPGSRQHNAVLAKIQERTRLLELQPAQGATPPPQTSGRSRAGGIAGILALIAGFFAKFKFLILLLLTKGKLLLLGLTKASTVLSMLLSFGVYWTMWGWKFAAGFVLSIYVHEMGHVYMLRRYGIRATAPMFIPGFGALIRLREALPTAREDARVGLAGPMWGLGAAVAAWAVWMSTGSPLFAAIAKVGAWINLFNLTPVWQLDGSRAFRAFSRQQRWIATAVILGAFLWSSEYLLVLLLACAAFRSFEKDAAIEPDGRGLGEYAFLTVTLTAMTMLPARV